MTTPRQLLDDCFLHDKDRMRHAEVLATIDQNLSLIVGDETINLDAAAGRIIAQDIVAPRNVPTDDNAAVDGYAFAHADYLATNGALSLGAFIAAGHPHSVTLKQSECARIFTGAIMPLNADTVAMQEDCDVEGNGKITIPIGLKLGANRRKSGEDLRQGTKVLEIGDVLNPARIAALASIGIETILVRKKLRIGIISTGNELIEPNETIKAGSVFDANRPMLKALLDCDMVTITDLGIVPDNEAELTKIVGKAAQQHDLILTTGSASRGDEDHMLNVLSTLGKRHLWQIAIKPGRPMMFGQIKNCVVMGLPGNPVASFVCAHLYVFPVIAKLLGTSKNSPNGYLVSAGFDIKQKKTDRREFLRGWLEVDEQGQNHAIKFPRDGSGLITGLRQATGLIEIPESIKEVRVGDNVRFIPFSAFKLD